MDRRRLVWRGRPVAAGLGQRLGTGHSAVSRVCGRGQGATAEFALCPVRASRLTPYGTVFFRPDQGGSIVFYHTETKPQTWRALVVFENGSECLLYLGRSTTQVRAGYREAYMELLDEEERAGV